MRLAISATLVMGAALASQARWTPHVDLAARSGHAMAYDSVRQVTWLFGGGVSRNDLWEWDGVVWRLRSAFVGPPPRTGHAMAFDSARGRLVLFGGQLFFGASAGELDDTWEWDGTTWIHTAPAQRPSPRSGARMVFDTARGRAVLFGGIHVANWQGTFYDDVWEWDGSNWTARTPSVRPPARAEAAMAFDRARGRTVMYGGWGGGGGMIGLPDTWEWDGNTWTERTPAVGPLLDRGATAVFAPSSGGVLLLGQASPFFQFPRMETWLFDGTTWAPVGGGPTGAGNFVVMAHDPARLRTVLFGGSGGGETWEFDGLAWRNVLAQATPAFRYQSVPSMVFDAARGVPVLVGNTLSGYQVETWERPGTAWVRRLGVGGPSISIGQAMTYDSVRGRTVLFGGQSPYGNDQTWEYDGNTWTQLTPSPRPPALYAHGMAFDPLRQRVVVFGTTSTSAPGITWEWDGATWTRHTPARTPWGRRYPGMAWHPGRQRVLLYGGGEGQSTSSLFPDFWEWDGTDWTQLAASIPPGERTRHGMVYDATRDRLVVHGGRDTRNVLTDTWEWDGATWTQRAPAENPGPTSDFAMIFDPTRDASLVFGGVPYLTWTYRPEVVASTVPFGTGCVGTAGRPELAADNRPWLGDGFRQVARNLRPASVAVLKFGASRQSWLGLPLPFDLSILGMLGCWQYVSTDLTVGLPTLSGTVTQTTPVPTDPSLRGARLYTQVFCLDVGANPFGATMSNALEVTLGAR